MSRLDDIQSRVDARMAELERRVNGGGLASGGGAAAARREVPAGGTGRSFAGEGDSGGPVFRKDEIAAVSDYAIRIVGTPPGNPPPFPSGDKWNTVAEMMSAAGITVGDCVVMAVKGCLGGYRQMERVTSRVFPNPKVLAKGVPPNPGSAPEEVLQRVCAAAAYYRLRWRYRKIDDITILWAYAELDVEADSQKAIAVGYCDNAYCLPLGNGKGLLCFSPNHSNLDTAGHEFTHAVTQATVDWIAYAGETGALNESFSDIFAKFNRWSWEGRGEGGGARWLYGGKDGEPIRDMAHPDSFVQGNGWRVASYYKQKAKSGEPNSGWYTGKGDNGGVHLNNGVIARLCFLLCEGESFLRDDGRRFEVGPIGYARTEELFGAILFGQRRYLPRAATMHAFCDGIRLAARDLGFSGEELRKLETACDAVNIVPPPGLGRGGAAERSIRMNTAVSRSLGERASMPQAVAEAFAEELGLEEAGAGFTVARDAPLVPVGGAEAERSGEEEREIVFEQTYKGVPVYGASAIARVRGGTVVTHLQNGFSRSLAKLRGASDRIGGEKAGAIALERCPGGGVRSIRQVVWDPAVLAMEGEPVLAWHVETHVEGLPEKQYLIDAGTGEIVFEAPLRTNEVPGFAQG